MKPFVKTCLVTALCCIVAGVCIIAAVQPVWPWSDKETSLETEKTQFSWEKTEEIKQLDVQIEVGTVTITEGDYFHVSVEDINEEDIVCYVENQVLHILDARAINEIVTVVPVSIYTEEVDVTITVPKNVLFEKLSLELGAGEMQVKDLEAETILVKVGAGSIVLDNLCAKQAVEFHIGTGEIRAYDFVGQNMTAKCGIGNLYVNGKLTGENSIECGIGEVVCELLGKEEDYSYTVNCGVGEVRIGTKEYHGISSNSKIGTGKDSFKVDCGIGSVKISFERRTSNPPSSNA